MIIDCAHYHGGRRRDQGPVSLNDAAARCEEGGFVWLGLLEPSEAELAQVRDTFGLHELAVEDAQTFHMRPKIENYDQGVQLVILRTARYDEAAEEVEFGEISIFLAPNFVITVRQGVASELRGARQRLEQRPELLAAGSSSALWAILDQIVDDYAPVVAGLEHDIDQVEATVFSGASAPTERIYSLRREATDFYRAVHPLLAVVTAIERATEAPQLQPYIRDVQDHLLLVNEEVAAQRDLLGTILEANMAVISVEQTKISVQQNSTVEQLTILATVFLPLTFVTGFFGQNFSWLIKNIDGPAAFVAYGIGGLVVPLTLLFTWLRHRRPRASTAPANERLGGRPASERRPAVTSLRLFRPNGPWLTKPGKDYWRNPLGLLDGKRALITGGTTGLGLAIAGRFLREGARVVITGRDQDLGERAEQVLGPGARFVAADAADPDAVASSVSTAADHLGGLDILVNNAGVGVAARLLDTPLADYDRVMNINVRGYLLYAQCAYPYLARGRGCMIHIASDAAIWGEQSIGLYSVTKAAVIMLGKMLALDGGPDGVRSNVLCPGDTWPGMRHMAPPGGQDRAEDQNDWPLPPIGRVGQASDVAAAAVFYACGETEFITGTTLLVDGGMTAGYQQRERGSLTPQSDPAG